MIVPALDPVIVPADEPVIVPTRFVREPVMVPANEGSESVRIKAVAPRIVLVVFIVVLLVNSVYWVLWDGDVTRKVSISIFTSQVSCYVSVVFQRTCHESFIRRITA